MLITHLHASAIHLDHSQIIDETAKKLYESKLFRKIKAIETPF